jgi:hypothetical protein
MSFLDFAQVGRLSRGPKRERQDLVATNPRIAIPSPTLSSDDPGLSIGFFTIFPLECIDHNVKSLRICTNAWTHDMRRRLKNAISNTKTLEELYSVWCESQTTFSFWSQNVCADIVFSPVIWELQSPGIQEAIRL